jgi:hypothetical protein
MPTRAPASYCVRKCIYRLRILTFCYFNICIPTQMSIHHVFDDIKILELCSKETTLLDRNFSNRQVKATAFGIGAATVFSSLHVTSWTGVWISIKSVPAAPSTSAGRIYVAILRTTPRARCNSFHIYLATLRPHTTGPAHAVVLITLPSSTGRTSAFLLATFSSKTGRIFCFILNAMRWHASRISCASVTDVRRLAC